MRLVQTSTPLPVERLLVPAPQVRRRRGAPRGRSPTRSRRGARARSGRRREVLLLPGGPLCPARGRRSATGGGEVGQGTPAGPGPRRRPGSTACPAIRSCPPSSRTRTFARSAGFARAASAAAGISTTSWTAPRPGRCGRATRVCARPGRRDSASTAIAAATEFLASGSLVEANRADHNPVVGPLRARRAHVGAGAAGDRRRHTSVVSTGKTKASTVGVSSPSHVGVAAARSAPRSWLRAPSPWQPDLGDGRYQNPVLHADYSTLTSSASATTSTWSRPASAACPPCPVLHSRDLGELDAGRPRGRPSSLARTFDTLSTARACGRPACAITTAVSGSHFGDPDRGIFLTRARDPRGSWEPLHSCRRRRAGSTRARCGTTTGRCTSCTPGRRAAPASTASCARAAPLAGRDGA